MPSAARGDDLHRTIDAATELDVLQAKARFAESIGGIEPASRPTAALELRAARHPLLIASGRDRRDCPVDDRARSRRRRVLLITGPNTGGKTVALKTAGLLPLMAQAGLHIPAADGTQVPVFQSSSPTSATSSRLPPASARSPAHIANIVAMDRALATAGAGAARRGRRRAPTRSKAARSAMAIVDHFRARGAMVVATTHYDALKTYASTTEGVASAAFGFDPETFAPTYRLDYGSPGSSLALEIATRLGLPAAIIEQARAHRTAREAQLAEHLAQDRARHAGARSRAPAGRARAQMLAGDAGAAAEPRAGAARRARRRSEAPRSAARRADARGAARDRRASSTR